jgi:hypothetical protein
VLQTLDQLATGEIAPRPTTVQATNIGSALELVERQSTTTNKLVFIISDGCDNDYFKANTRDQVAQLKLLGVEIHIIYIPSGGVIACPSYLKELASSPVSSHYSPILEPPYYDNLNTPEFIGSLLDKSCLEIESVTPDSVCNSTRRNIAVTGKGFANTEDLSKFECKFIIAPCVDDPDWLQPTINADCSFLQGNPALCAAIPGALENCPQTCESCPDKSRFCQDDPTYSDQCKEWTEKGQCETTPEFMVTHCASSCGKCGHTQAVVIDDTRLICRSPPLGSLTDFSFEITRNGITWTQGDVKVSTYDCGGTEEDDSPVTNLVPSMTVEVNNNKHKTKENKGRKQRVFMCMLFSFEPYSLATFW